MFIIFFLILQDTLIRWEPEVNLTQDTVYNLTPWIEVNGNYVHIVWEELDKSVYYQRSTDSGSTWSVPIKLSDTTELVIHPKLAVWGDTVHCIWVSNWTGGNNWHILYRRSLDSGGSWDNLIDLGFSNLVSGLEAIGETVFVIMANADTTIFGLYLKKSFDGGVTWSVPTLIIQANSGYDPQILYNNGYIHLIWLTGTYYPPGIYYIRSSDLGNTWSDTLRLSAYDSYYPQEPVAVNNEQGVIFVGWPDNKYSTGWLDDVLLRVSNDNGVSWGPEIMVTTHHLVNHDEDHASTREDLYFVWPKAESGNNALQFRASTDMGETWWPIEDICNNLVFDGSVATDFPKIHSVWRDRRSFPSEIYYRRGTRLPVGIEETRRQRDKETGRLEVWPNPFRNYCVIQYVLSSKHYAPGEVVSVKMYDVLGKEVMSLRQRDKETEGRGEIRIETKGLPAGVYFVQVESGSISEIKKTVKIE